MAVLREELVIISSEDCLGCQIEEGMTVLEELRGYGL